MNSMKSQTLNLSSKKASSKKWINIWVNGAISIEQPHKTCIKKIVDLVDILFAYLIYRIYIFMYQGTILLGSLGNREAFLMFLSPQ